MPSISWRVRSALHGEKVSVVIHHFTVTGRLSPSPMTLTHDDALEFMRQMRTAIAEVEEELRRRAEGSK